MTFKEEKNFGHGYLGIGNIENKNIMWKFLIKHIWLINLLNGIIFALCAFINYSFGWVLYFTFMALAYFCLSFMNYKHYTKPKLPLRLPGHSNPPPPPPKL